MAQITIGRVRPAFVGTWSSGTQYSAMDCVSYNGRSYAAKQDVPLGTATSNTTYWQLMSDKGDTGATGATGPQGPQGPTGATGAQGNQGVQGPQGIAGVDGADGLRGGQFATGGAVTGYSTAETVGDIYYHDNGTIYRVTGPSTFTAIGVWEGTQGATGPQGPQGNTGATGPKGADGADGVDGAQGVAGPAPDHEWSSYSVRFKNPDGSWGTYKNLRGATGAQGVQGIQGQQGIQGLKGDTGATGAQGPIGPQGPQGPSGADGPAGADGLPGVAATQTQAQAGTDNVGYMTALRTAQAIAALGLPKTGGTMTGHINMNNRNLNGVNAVFINDEGGNEGLVFANGTYLNTIGTTVGPRLQTAHGYIELGAQNTAHAHIYTDRPDFYFNKELRVNGSKVLHTGDEIAADNTALLNGKDGGYYRCGSGCSWTCSSSCSGSCMAGCTGCSGCSGGCTSCTGTCTGTCKSGCTGSCDGCKNA